MGICQKAIAKAISSNCINPLFTGKAQRGFIINKADLASYTASDNIISAITLATGAHAYAVEIDSKAPFQGTVTALEAGDIRNAFTNTVVFHVPNDGANFRKDIVDNLANGKFVVIVENEWQGSSGDNAFSVYGVQKGLVAGDGDFTEDADNGGWTFTLTEQGVPKSGWYFWSSDYATTVAALEALLPTP